MLQLVKLANRDKGTTINFTVSRPATARTSSRTMRWRTPTSARSLRRNSIASSGSLPELAKNKLIPDTEVTTSLTRGFPIMPQNAQTDALAAMAQRVYGEIGKTLKLGGSGGAADSSLSAGVFKPTLDGLSLIGGNAHTDR